MRARLALAGSGVLAFVLSLIGGFSLGRNQPGATDSVESVRSYIAANWVGIHIHHTFAALGLGFGLVFATFLWSVLRQAEAEPPIFATLALIGAAVAVSVHIVVTGVHSATFVDAANTAELRSLATAVVRELTILELFPWTAFFAGVALVSLTRDALPRWLGWLSAVLAVLDLLVGAWSGLAGVNARFDIGSFIPPFVLIHFVPPLWLAAASVVLLRRELMTPPDGAAWGIRPE